MRAQSAIVTVPIAALLFCNAAFAGGPPTYRVIKINVESKAGDSDAQATAIAEGREPATAPWVSVQIATGEGLSRALRCNPDNVCVDPFPKLPAGGSATAVDITNRGTMIGVRQDPGQDPFGFVASNNGAFISFGSLKDHCPNVKGFIPQAISNSGYISGVAPGCHGKDRPTYWHSSRFGLRVDSFVPRDATAIRYFDREKGAKAGEATFADGHSEAFVYWRGIHLLGTLGGPNSVATAVRYSYAVGCSDTEIAGEQKAFWWGGPNGQAMTALPVFGDGPYCATGVNYKPVIVGNGQKSGQAWPSTSFYYRDGIMYDLNDLLQASDRKYHILRVAGITAVGDIAATAVSDDDSHTVAVRLEIVKKP